MSKEKLFLKIKRDFQKRKEVLNVLGRIPWKGLFLIVVTASVGNKIASGYEERLWERQDKAEILREEVRVATETFEEISESIDKRIYRMDKLVRWLRDNSDQEMIKNQMDEYREVLYEWNDGYNRNKAKIRLYYGKDIADRFDYIHGFFKEIGIILEEEYYKNYWERNEEVLNGAGHRIGDLNNMSFEMSENMLKKIQKREVGFFLK